MTRKDFYKISRVLKTVLALIVCLTAIICVFGSICYVCKASAPASPPESFCDNSDMGVSSLAADANANGNGLPTTIFMILLSVFSVITTLVTEGIKNIVTDKENLPYNIVALISSLIIGGVGTAAYYQLNSIPFTTNNIIYIVLMGLASGLVSMVGFDKVKQAITQITCKK